MKINNYLIIRDKLTNNPSLKIESTFSWKNDFLSQDNIVDFLNQKYHMNILEEEYVYVISFNWQMVPQGVFQLSHGTAKNSLIGKRELAIFLLLTGANKFILAHNHPNGTKEFSKADVEITEEIMKMADAIGVKFEQHFTIGNDGYDTIIEDEDEDRMPFGLS